LVIAAKMGHDLVVDNLLGAGADANLATRQGTTPLLAAAQNGHGTVVDSLLEAGADSDQATDAGLTPLCIAAKYGHAVIIQVPPHVHFQYTKPRICPAGKPS